MLFVRAGFGEGTLHLTEFAEFPGDADANPVSELSTVRYKVGDLIQCRVLLPRPSKNLSKKLHYHLTMRITSDAAVAKHRRQEDRPSRLCWKNATPDAPLLFETPKPQNPTWAVITKVSSGAVQVSLMSTACMLRFYSYCRVLVHSISGGQSSCILIFSYLV